MNSLLSYEQEKQIMNKSYYNRTFDIQIRPNTELIPVSIKEGKMFQRDIKEQVIMDDDFRFKGLIKTSFATIIDKYPTISNP